MRHSLLELSNVSCYFGSVIALKDVSMDVRAGEVHCLLGDNGAGKSTLIKILSGVHRPSDGDYVIDGETARLRSPRDAQERGIATVFQDLALVPLMSMTRNFFMGREPTRGWGPFRRFDLKRGDRIARDGLARMGIHVRDPSQPVGTMSGGERQCLAIARAVHFGARVLILDEPTAALGVKQSANVIKVVARVRQEGLAVILITHNVHHAYPVADRFTLLNRGRSLGTYDKREVSREQVLTMMAGGEELQELEMDLKEFERSDAASAEHGGTNKAPALAGGRE